MSNSIGTLFRLTTFGESHGEAFGGVIDGMPAGVPIDLIAVQSELNRRRPAQNHLTTARKEPDEVELLSGLFEGRTTGTPIGFIVRNTNQHPSDYDNLRDIFRPSHADYTYTAKYGLRDHRGGGRSSARETVSRVVAGAFAKQYLATKSISIVAYTSQVGSIVLAGNYKDYDLSLTESNPVRCPDKEIARRMEELIMSVKKDGDTIGGRIDCIISGCPAGLGEPVFDKMHARLSAAMLSINAAHAFEYGDIARHLDKRGSQLNDIFTTEGNRVRTLTNHSGGIQGGISNGEDIYFSVAFKPVATILSPQPTIAANSTPATVTARGRHDPCVLPRAVPIVEAMAAITVMDMLLMA